MTLSCTPVPPRFNLQLPPRHEEFHPALFAAAWTSPGRCVGEPRGDANDATTEHAHAEPVQREEAPTNPACIDRHLLPTVRPAPMPVATTWDSVKVRAGRLAFSRSRDCHGLVRSFYDLI